MCASCGATAADWREDDQGRKWTVRLREKPGYVGRWECNFCSPTEEDSAPPIPRKK